MVRKTIYFVLGLLAASFSLPSAFANGTTLGSGYWSYCTGLGCVAVVGFGIWALPDVFESIKARRLSLAVLMLPFWLVAFSTTLMSSITNAASNRGNAVQSKDAAVQKFEHASARITELKGELDTAKRSPLWENHVGVFCGGTQGGFVRFL